MIRITNNQGLTLELPPDLVLTGERNNSLFNDSDTLFQDMSYPISIPKTPANMVFMGMGHLVEAENGVYVQAVKFDITGIPISAGNLRYRVTKKSYEGNLEPNLAALTDKIKGIRITELLTEDSVTDIPGSDEFDELMLDTVQHPERYPFAFIPVNNPSVRLYTGVGETDSLFINFFNQALQKFESGNLALHTAHCPYWKLTYLLAVIAEYLNLQPTGDFFTDPEMQSIYIYSRVYHLDSADDQERIIKPMAHYLPNVQISDCLKYLRNRFHLSINPDILNGELRVERYKTINAKQPVDLTGIISADPEQELPAEQNIKVSLKSDTDDKMFEVVDAYDNTSYPPNFTLVAGTGEKPVELDISTVKTVDESVGSTVGRHYPRVNQPGHSINAYQPTQGFSYTDESDPTTINNFAFRLIKYDGFLDVAGGFYPCASAYDLNNDDKDWYDFMANGRELKFTANVHAAVLAQISLADKFCYRSEGKNYLQFIIRQLVFDARNNSDMTDVLIKAKACSLEKTIKSVITPQASLTPMESGGIPFSTIAGRFKAYFDPLIHGISQVNLEIWDATTNEKYVDIPPITNPANAKGSGGLASAIPVQFTANPYEIRVLIGVPRYVLHMGKRIPFVAEVGYYVALVDYGDLTYNYPPDTYTIFF